jgi:hypothetical protein
MSPRQYGEVLMESDKQCVTGLVTDCLKTNNITMTKRCVIHMLKYQNTLTVENKHINSNLKNLVDLLNRHAIPFIVVKGQTLAIHYPNPLLRIAGDIDFYVPPSDFDRAQEVIRKEWGVEEFEQMSDDKTLNFDYNGSILEMHKALLLFARNRNRRYFSNLLETTPPTTITIDGCIVPTLEPTLNVFYTFGHIYHHFRLEGVAFRQLCDLAMLIHAYRDEIDKERLKEMLKSTGYTLAFLSIGDIVIKKLGLPAEEFPMEITPQAEKYSELMLKEILKGGNWGQYSREIHDKSSILHTLETGKIQVYHYLRYFKLSPGENLSIIYKNIPERLIVMWKRFGPKFH